jgi:hypothetical protein
MKKYITLIGLSFLTLQFSYGQNEKIDFLKTLYKTIDSLNKLDKPFAIDSATQIEVKSLDTQHPTGYFMQTAILIKANKFNEASFLYYLGILRYKFYNSVNPNYSASDDGALTGSLQWVFGETINLYLKSNINNFIAALKYTTEYFKNNDYLFCSKHKGIDKYNKLCNNFSSIIADLEKNKDKYKREWEEHKKGVLENIKKAEEEYNKMSDEEKDKFKN